MGFRRIDSDLWVADTPLRFLVELGRRMTVVQVGGGELLVHSPAPLSDQLRRELAELGAVRFVVPASSLHGHLFMEQYRAAYPRAELFAAPGLAKKRPDIRFDVCFNIEASAPLSTRLWAWGPRLKQRAAPTPLFRAAIRDRQAARESVRRILSWEFDRIVVGHGGIIEAGGREVFRAAWSWLED